MKTLKIKKIIGITIFLTSLLLLVPGILMAAMDYTAVLEKYSFVDPQGLIPSKLKNTALIYYDQNLSRIPNSNFLSVIDFARKSSQKRFFIIDMKTGEVLAYHTAHGKGRER